MKNIAIIGSGISGLTTAYLLSKHHNVKVFEKNDYIGGHTATVNVPLDGKTYQIDTGFIVFNDRTYPNFQKLLTKLDVAAQPTEMSFSVQNKQTGLEYNGNNLNSLFAQRQNLFSLKFWRLLKHIIRFNRLCKSLYHKRQIPKGETLGSFLDEHGFNQFFCQNYILPMAAAIWSSSLNQTRQFELQFFIRFFYHHGLLNIQDRPQWYVIPGGSKNYIPPLIEPFKSQIELNTELTGVSRSKDRVTLHFENEHTEDFDEVVFACHSDQALALLTAPTKQERAILKALPYVKNHVVLHTDTSLLPENRLAWASWNYQLLGDDNRLASVTYNMNILQGIKSDTTFCVTLNQPEAISKKHILQEFEYDHPVFNQISQQAQLRRNEICGKNRTHFVGAYWYNGFHEDGVKSALDVARRFGAEL